VLQYIKGWDDVITVSTGVTVGW